MAKRFVVFFISSLILFSISCKYDIPVSQDFDSYLEMRGLDAHPLVLLEDGSFLILQGGETGSSLYHISDELMTLWAYETKSHLFDVQVDESGYCYVALMENKTGEVSTYVFSIETGVVITKLPVTGLLGFAGDRFCFISDSSVSLFKYERFELLNTTELGIEEDYVLKFTDFFIDKSDNFVFAVSNDNFISSLKFTTLLCVFSSDGQIFNNYELCMKQYSLESFDSNLFPFVSLSQRQSDKVLFAATPDGVYQLNSSNGEKIKAFDYKHELMVALSRISILGSSNQVDYNPDLKTVIVDGLSFNQNGEPSSSSRGLFFTTNRNLGEPVTEGVWASISGLSSNKIIGYDESRQTLWELPIPHKPLIVPVIENFVVKGDGSAYVLARYKKTLDGYVYRLWKVRLY